MHLAHSSARSFLAVALALIASAAPAAAQQQQPRCSAPEHRQFDFWVGAWEVRTPDDRLAGRNVIEPILDGCALRERWTGAGGVAGTSFNIWDRTRRGWHQTWVDSNGMLLQLDGGLQGDAMVMEGTTLGRDGAPVRNRITWTPLESGDVRQLWEVSSDDGASWNTIFDGRYVRVTP